MPDEGRKTPRVTQDQQQTGRPSTQEKASITRSAPALAVDRLGAWPVRVAWLLLPLLAGPALEDALGHMSRPVQIVASTGLWGFWVLTLVATLVPTTVTLTVLRIMAPGALAAVLAGSLVTGVVKGEEVTPWYVVGAGWATVAVLTAFLPAISVIFVNGSSYGDEIRLPLRVPGPLLLGPVQGAWLVTVVAGTSGPLLLAAKQWVLGGVMLLVGVPAVWWGVRVLHTLSRRWTVFVPGGLVVHDPLALVYPVLLRRGTIVSLGPAPADTQALDISCGALGLAVEARLQRPVPLVLAPGSRQRRAKEGDAGRSAAEVQQADALLFTPTRPGAFLRTARERTL